MDVGDEELLTTRDQRETKHMDTSPTKRKTGTVPAKLSNYNGRMRWSDSKPDRRHRHQSNGKERRNWANNKNRNLSEKEEQSQSTRQRDPVPTNPEPTTGPPTSAKIPAGPFMDHEDRKRKPTTTADRAQRRKSERDEACEKSHSRRREKQSLLEKIAGPLMPAPLRSRRSSLEGGEADRGGGKFQTSDSTGNRNKNPYI